MLAKLDGAESPSFYRDDDPPSSSVPLMLRQPGHVEFRNVKISSVTYLDAYGIISDCLTHGRKGFVCLTDVGNVIAATQDIGLKTAINNSLLSLADGTPLAWFARLVGCRNIERVSGMDLMARLFQDNDSYRHFLLGDTERTIERVREKALKLNSNLRISGYSPPFRQFSEEDNRDIIERIDAERPDIIWVSLGGGRQEKWMLEHHDKVEKGVMIGVGAGFRWFIGDIKTPPRIVQKAGLQWLFRWFSEMGKDPAKAMVGIWTRPMKRFPVFIAHFPFQLLSERKKMKGLGPEKRDRL